LKRVDGKDVPLQAAFRTVLAGDESGYCFEVVCPWRALGFRPSIGATLGFDTTLFDADDGLEAQVEAAWAGFRSGLEDPGAYGQLILRK
jgi:hypothetical protein